MKKVVIFFLLFAVSVYGIAQNDTLYATVSGDSVTIWHMNSYRNCGSLFDIQADFDDHMITITEVDTGQLAYCMCYFDLSVTLTGLEPGMYSVDVYGTDDDGVYFGRFYFEIGADFSYSMTDCLEIAKDDSSYIELTVHDNYLDIYWNDAYLNCCPDLLWSQWFTTDTFHIDLIDNGVCDCNCYYNLGLGFGPIEPGTYVLDFLNGMYGYPAFTISESKDGPEAVSSYQSPCGFPQNIKELGLNPVDVKIFPNPIKETFTIAYTLHKNGLIQFTLHNILGKQVKTLFNKYQPAGSYSIKIEDIELNEGVYILKTNLNNYSFATTLIK